MLSAEYRSGRDKTKEQVFHFYFNWILCKLLQKDFGPSICTEKVFKSHTMHRTHTHKHRTNQFTKALNYSLRFKMSAVWQSRKPKIPIRIGKANEWKKERKKNAAVKLRAHFHSNQSLPHLDIFGLVLVCRFALEWLLNIERKWFLFCLPLQYIHHSSFNLLFIVCSPLTVVSVVIFLPFIPSIVINSKHSTTIALVRFFISIMICSCEFLWMV